VSVRILIKQTDMPSCVFIKTCWSLSEAYYIPEKLCHFQSSGIFKLKNGWHYEKTNVIFGLSAPKKHQETPKNQNKKTRPKICCPVIIYQPGLKPCLLSHPMGMFHPAVLPIAVWQVFAPFKVYRFKSLLVVLLTAATA